MSLLQTQLFIDGQWRPSADQSTFDVLNPATERVVEACSNATAEDVRDACQAAASAFTAYKKTTAKVSLPLARRPGAVATRPTAP